jgi:uncharacterized protein YdeI (YjbR/CyaY-like superfamily)
VEEALCFGWIDSVMNPLDDQRLKQLLTPGKPGGTWSASNKIRVERLTSQGLMRPAGLAAIDAAMANGSWTILDEVDALVVPSDLAAALAADPAAANFEALPASARRAFLWCIISAKRPETRAKRVAETARMAAENRRLGESGGQDPAQS